MATLNKYCTDFVAVASHADDIGLNEIIMIRSIVTLKHRPHCIIILVRQLLRHVEGIIFMLFYYHTTSSSEVILPSDLIISRVLMH